MKHSWSDINLRELGMFFIQAIAQWEVEHAVLVSNLLCGHCVVATGECRKAARDELRKGAHCIKVMASGGVASPTDRSVSP